MDPCPERTPPTSHPQLPESVAQLASGFVVPSKFIYRALETIINVMSFKGLWDDLAPT